MKEQIRQLAERNRMAKTADEKEAIAKEMEALKNQNPEAFTEALESLIHTTAKEVEDLTIAEKMGEVTKMISMAYIAKTYFGKSRSWLYHKFSGMNNGVSDDFNDIDRDRLKAALNDIAARVSAAADRL